MINEQINIAIAEHCGWTSFGIFSGRSDRPAAFRPGCTSPEVIPNYCNDLNAMHEAENWILKIIHEQGDDFLFLDHLIIVCKNNNPVHATARQRAEAFLRTIGKWEE